MVELDVTGKVSEIQDLGSEIAREIDDYSREILNSIVLGEITTGDAIAELDATVEEAIRALRNEIAAINGQYALAVSHILRNTQS